MATLLLVRHGVTASTGRRAGGRTDAALTDGGRAQADAVADRLGRSRVDATYASPTPRASETAERIAAAIGTEVEVLDGIEELDHGRWTDRSLKQMASTKHFEQVVRTPSRVALPEGEAFIVAQSRAVRAIESIVERHREDATLVAVSHADIIKLLVTHYAGAPLDAFQRLVIAPASISRLQLPKQGTPRILGLNDTGHLEGAT